LRWATFRATLGSGSAPGQEFRNCSTVVPGVVLAGTRRDKQVLEMRTGYGVQARATRIHPRGGYKPAARQKPIFSRSAVKIVCYLFTAA